MSSLKTSLTGAAVAAFVAIAPVAALADNPGQTHGQSSTHANHGKSKMHFTANGKVTAVATDSFTMHVKGGSKDLHGTDVTVTVTDTTKMRRNGAKATVADLQVGDRLNANGSRAADGTLTARHVNAHGPDASDSTDTSSTDTGSTDAGSTPSPSPTDTPAPTDSPAPTSTTG